MKNKTGLSEGNDNVEQDMLNIETRGEDIIIGSMIDFDMELYDERETTSAIEDITEMDAPEFDFFQKFASMNQQPTIYNRNDVGKIDYEFDYTSFEDLTDEELTRMFYYMQFSKANVTIQMDLIQELVNRLTKEMGLKDKVEVYFLDNPDNPVSLNNGIINVDMNTMEMPMLLYVKLAGLIEQQRQIEYAIEHPDSPIAIQLRNDEVEGIKTSDEYEHSKIIPMRGTGLTYFGPSMSTNIEFKFIEPQRLEEIREQEKAKSNDYYIKRLQPIDREIAKAMEIAMRKIESQMLKDGIFEPVERGSLYCVQSAIGDYIKDRNEYMQRCEFPFPEDQIDAFLLDTARGTQQMQIFNTPTLETDIQLASMRAYVERDEKAFIDPRENREYEHNREDFAQMSKEDIMRCFYPENWNKLALEEKKMLLQELCNRETQELGLKRDYKIVFKEIQDGNAYYNPIEKNIYFNTTSLLEGNPIFLYGLIPHELVHAKQDEIRDGLTPPRAPKEQEFLVNSSFANKNLTTPNQYNGQPITPINAIGLKQMNYFRPLYIQVTEETKPKMDEAFALYKLQIVEYEAYKHQEDKEQLFKQQMIVDGKFDEQARTMFDQLEIGNTTYMENILRKSLGCTNPIEAIRQFQMYVANVVEDYDPQTEACDFAMRYNLIATSTHMQYRVYPQDPRDNVNLQEQNLINARIPKEVTTRLSQGDQQNPVEFVTPLGQNSMQLELTPEDRILIETILGEPEEEYEGFGEPDKYENLEEHIEQAFNENDKDSYNNSHWQDSNQWRGNQNIDEYDIDL